MKTNTLKAGLALAVLTGVLAPTMAHAVALGDDKQLNVAFGDDKQLNVAFGDDKALGDDKQLNVAFGDDGASPLDRPFPTA